MRRRHFGVDKRVDQRVQGDTVPAKALDSTALAHRRNRVPVDAATSEGPPTARTQQTSLPTPPRPASCQFHPMRPATDRTLSLATRSLATLALLSASNACVKELAADTPNFFTSETTSTADRVAMAQDRETSPNAANDASAKQRNPRQVANGTTAAPTNTPTTTAPPQAQPTNDENATAAAQAIDATVAAASNTAADTKRETSSVNQPAVANPTDNNATTNLGPLTAPPPRVPTNGAAVVSTGEAGPAAPQVPTTTMAAARDDLISAFFANIEAPVRAAAATPPELANIKLTLMPHWARDVDRPGTVSLQLPFSVKGQGPDRTFFFSYGHEKVGAPKDREAYKKWLADEKIMIVKVDRQRNGAWYLEGTAPAGHPMFRFQVNYGDKIVYCGGSMYRDPESARLGKLRDDIIIGARQVCASVSL